MMDGDPTRADLERLAERIVENLPALARTLVGVSQTLEGYRLLDPSAVAGTVRSLTLLVAEMVRGRRVPRADLENLLRPVAQQRTAEGIPVTSQLRLIHLSHEELVADLVRAAGDLGISEGALAEPLAALRDMFEVGMNVAIEAGELQSDPVRAGARQRMMALYHLLDERADRSNLHEIARSLNLRIDVSYLAYRVRPGGDVDSERACEALGPVLRLAGDLAGISQRAPQISAPGVIIAVGPPGRVEELHRSFTAATRIVTAAAAFGLSGTLTKQDLDIRVALIVDPDIGEAAVARRLTPLAPLGAFGEVVVRTVAAFCDDMRVEAVAKRLRIHPNTVRYRLQRYALATGSDFGTAADVADIWLALEHRGLQAER